VQGFGVEALAGRTRPELDARYDELRAICSVP
jgi:hypothetical protein